MYCLALEIFFTMSLREIFFAISSFGRVSHWSSNLSRGLRHCFLFLRTSLPFCDAVSRVPERRTPTRCVHIGNREDPTLGCSGKCTEYGQWGYSIQGSPLAPHPSLGQQRRSAARQSLRTVSRRRSEVCPA